MAEALEGIMPPAVVHEEGENKDCPFCPIEKGKGYTTYKGVDNDSDTLEKIMVEPSSLLTHQKNAWPHTGEKHPTREAKESEWHHPTYGDYEFQAHHLVSGKQALQNHPFERWIASERSHVEEDTGYAINGSLNGLWAPSWPKKFRTGDYEGEWTSDDTDREGIANFVMEREKCQFHLGAHNIGDPKDPGQIRHKRYDCWLKAQLAEMDSRMVEWTKKCPLCSADGNPHKPPFQPNERVNRYLNNLSASARRHLKAKRQHWFIFLSRLALKYHEGVCEHEIPGKQVVAG
jgi:hypothetical protein